MSELPCCNRSPPPNPNDDLSFEVETLRKVKATEVKSQEELEKEAALLIAEDPDDKQMIDGYPIGDT
jgi:hypothetical protein